MKKTFFSLFIAIFAIVSFSLTSCENNQLEDVSPISGVSNELNTAQDDDVDLLQTKSSNTSTCEDWVEKDYKPVYDNYYDIREVYQNGRKCSFKVLINYPSLKNFEVYVKTYSPSGECLYHPMRYNGYYFEYEKNFNENGTYHYRYFVRLDKNKKELTKIHSDSKKFSLNLNVPGIENNYNTKDYDFVLNNCTSWVTQKINEMWGQPHAFNNNAFVRHLGHAYNWKSVLDDSGYEVSNEPLPGDIAWWDSNAPGALELGHVAFVNEVRSNGTIVITEYNYYPANVYNKREFNKSYPKYPTAFIHVQFKQ